jgi:hypothetical protein
MDTKVDNVLTDEVVVYISEKYRGKNIVIIYNIKEE